jgi:hypothetical protein
VKWLARLSGNQPPAPEPAGFAVDRDPVVAALVERCARITRDETSHLAGAWATIEGDADAHAALAEGARLAGLAAPHAEEAAANADWAFRVTLSIPGDGSLYAAHDPIHGRAIEAIRMRALAVAARDALPPDVAEAMSDPWRQAMDDG